MTDRPAERALALVGTRFRAQGREPGHGLDCVGLVICAHRLPADVARRDYRLRGDHRSEMLECIQPFFKQVRPTERRAGDVLMLKVAADQYHLTVATETGFVHADARLGRVVVTPGSPGWPVVAVFRRRVRSLRQGRG